MTSQGRVRTSNTGTVLSIGVALLSLAGPALAQVVGNVAAVERTAEVGRAGSWAPARAGQPVQMGDSVRTDGTGRVKIAFGDGSVAVVSSRSELVIDQYVYDPSKSGGSSYLELLKGKVRTIVSEYYSEAGEYEVRTPTATAGVRGTDFIVAYDPATEITDVVGNSGSVFVRGLARAAAEEVLITAGTQTSVARGQAPTEPRRLDEERFRYYMEDLEFVGRGRSEGIGFTQPMLSGAEVPPPDRAEAGDAGQQGLDLDSLQQGQGTGQDASGLADEPPAALEAGDVGVDF